MKAKHTPGPWAVIPQPCRKGFKFAVCGEEFWPAAIFSDGRENAGTAEANANLIASAPELLDALRYMVDNAEAAGWSGLMLRDARAAISKAEGLA